MLIVIGTAPTMDTPVAAGPFKTEKAALDARSDLEQKGYVADIVPLEKTSEIEPADAWVDDVDPGYTATH